MQKKEEKKKMTQLYSLFLDIYHLLSQCLGFYDFKILKLHPKPLFIKVLYNGGSWPVANKSFQQQAGSVQWPAASH